MAVEKLKERKEMDPAYMWKLGKMYENDEAWEEDLASMKDEPARLSAYMGTLNTPENVRKFYDDLTDIFTRMDKVYCYASLRSSEDTREEKAKSMDTRAMSLYVALSTALSFADPADYELLEQGEKLCIENIPAGLESGEFTLSAGGRSIRLLGSFSQRQKAVLRAGGLLNYTREENA